MTIVMETFNLTILKQRQQNVASYLMDIIKCDMTLRKRKPVSQSAKQRRHSTPILGCHDSKMQHIARVRSAGSVIRWRSIADVRERVSIGDVVLLGDQVTMAIEIFTISMIVMVFRAWLPR